jgi:hypothetical protein
VLVLLHAYFILHESKQWFTDVDLLHLNLSSSALSAPSSSQPHLELLPMRTTTLFSDYPLQLAGHAKCGWRRRELGGACYKSMHGIAASQRHGLLFRRTADTTLSMCRDSTRAT